MKNQKSLSHQFFGLKITRLKQELLRANVIYIRLMANSYSSLTVLKNPAIIKRKEPCSTDFGSRNIHYLGHCISFKHLYSIYTEPSFPKEKDNSVPHKM